MTKDLRIALRGAVAMKTAHVDPEELFRGLKIRATSAIKELWAPQADALRKWHEARENKDILLRLNTGAGKTLVGLVAAQSLVNELRAKVVYCCATNQLVEQTREKADSLGIDTATYHSGEWRDKDVFFRATGPVLTNYAALFNGMSVFARESIVGVVFDDAHTAHDSVRSAFTLRLARNDFSAFYDTFVDSVRAYFESVRRGYELDAVTQRRDRASVLMVPMYELARNWKKWQDALIEAGVEQSKSTKFVWAHVGARIDRMTVMIDAEGIEFTPLLPPTDTLRVFRDGVRRLYLSATLQVNDEFIRTFGRRPSPVITPGGRAGDTERLFLLAPAEMPDQAARGWAEDATKGLKAVIMVPSGATAAHWKAEVFGSEAGHERIRRFAASRDERLVFVARYDGIDLPGDACRVMIVDGAPGGMSHLDRFFEVHLEREGVSDSRIASRFIQLLGRTSRGLSDHGVVLLIGRRLREWVSPPARRELLPDHIQRQLSAGERIASAEGFNARDLVEKCLAQSADWIETYELVMSQTVAEPARSEPAQATMEKIAVMERRFASALWGGDWNGAYQQLAGLLPEAYEHERVTGAWLEHWAGFAAQMSSDTKQGERHYRASARVKSDLGALPEPTTNSLATDAGLASSQTQRMAELLSKRGRDRIESDLTSSASMVLRDGAASAGQHEAAICTVGEYLGYDIRRADKDTSGKGHDCIWIEPNGARVLLFDAKTQMSRPLYSKEYIGQSAQHALWAASEYAAADRLLYIVGPRVGTSPQSTPPAGLRVVAAEEIARVADVLAAIYKRASDRNLPLFVPADLELGLNEHGLTWELLPQSLDTIRIDALSN